MEHVVRTPDINYEECFPKWAPDLEFAMTWNAFSILPVHLEPYLIKVFNQAKPLLDPVKDAELIKEVDWFCAQEGQHYRQHAMFNRVFQTPRYPEVEPIGKQYGKDLEDYRKNRSLIFNLAYVEGFESGGGVFYRRWFEDFGEYRVGARQEVLQLFDWHMAEEFEHREVAYKLYMRLAANGNIFRRIWYGYFYRIYGVVKMMGHGGLYIDQIRKHLLDVERKEMTPEEAKASVGRELKFGKLIFRKVTADLIAVLSPFYDPAKKPPPAGLENILADFARGGKFAKKSEKPIEAS